MNTSEALSRIRELSGVPDLSYWQLRYLIKKGLLDAPRLNSSLVWVWSEKDVRRAVKVVKERASQYATADA